MKTEKELIEIIYDYITVVSNKQGKLLPVKTLYGDGSRFENNYKVFEIVYNSIKGFLIS